ncbi:MAG: helix-turn-helix transcriptional regulator [Chloroflexota bacterium]
MTWKEHKKQLLKNPEFRKEYMALEPEYRVAASVIKLRLLRGLTQEQLARPIKTKQSSIARLESGTSLPSLSMLRRVADALDAKVEVELQPR